MSKHLKEESHYEDRYDLFTIQDCLRTIEFFHTFSEKQYPAGESRKLSRKEHDKAIATALNLKLFVIKGERYRNRSAIIHDWMERDRRYDEKLETAIEPSNAKCPKCSGSMDIILKDLAHLEGNTQKVLFFLECRSCGKRKGIYDDGEPYVSRTRNCPKCRGQVKYSYKKRGSISTLSTICSSCKFREDDVYDPDREQRDKAAKEVAEKELLNKHRQEFCLSPKEGVEYIEHISRLELLREQLEEQKQRRVDPIYQKLVALKRLSIVELEKLVSEAVARASYRKLILEKPEIGRHVIVPFMVQDADASRKEHDSVRKLQRIVKASLAGTNWRLMSEGSSYKLGYLTGRLKGFDLEEDLLKLAQERS